jgi:hypothetical protein
MAEVHSGFVTTRNATTALSFVPTRVEGLPEVAEVTVRPDRLELVSDGRVVTVVFDEIALWPRPRWLSKALARIGLRPHRLPVGERDWFHQPGERFICFYSSPRIVLFLPDDPADESPETYFRRVQDVLAEGGFDTFDLG